MCSDSNGGGRVSSLQPPEHLLSSARAPHPQPSLPQCHLATLTSHCRGERQARDQFLDSVSSGPSFPTSYASPHSTSGRSFSVRLLLDALQFRLHMATCMIVSLLIARADSIVRAAQSVFTRHPLRTLGFFSELGNPTGTTEESLPRRWARRCDDHGVSGSPVGTPARMEPRRPVSISFVQFASPKELS